MAETEIAGIIVPAVVTDDAKPVVGLLIQKYEAGKDSLSLADMHEVLNYGLERLLALRMDKEREVLRHIEQKYPSGVYRIWRTHVSNIEKKVASLNAEEKEKEDEEEDEEEEEEEEQEEDEEEKEWRHEKRGILEENMKRALSEVIKLLGDECLKEILVDVPSISEYPTLQKAFQDVQTLLQIDEVKCVALHGQTGVAKRTIVQHLNNHYCGSVDFDVVIFIKLADDYWQDDLHILQKIAESIQVDREGHIYEVAGRIRKVLENKRYLLILNDLTDGIYGIWEMLDISNDENNSKVVITTYEYHPFWGSGGVDGRVELGRLSRTEEWKMSRHIVGHNHLPPTAKPASPLQGESSSKSSTNPIGKQEILVDVPSFAEYPTLQKAFQDVKTLLRIDRVKCVVLHGQTGVAKTTIMQHLNNHFCGTADFDVVIFIKLAADDEQTDLYILRKIAERIKVDREGHEFKVAGSIRKVLENKRCLLILDGVRNPIYVICRMLDISKDEKDSKIVITTYYDYADREWERGWGWGWGCVDVRLELGRLSRTEAWKMFQHTVDHNHLPPTAKPASPLEGESSSKSCTMAIGKQHLDQDVLRLLRLEDFVHLMLSYPMRIGYEEKFLKKWINDVYELSVADDPDFDSIRRRVKRLLYDESPLRYVQAVIPQDITTEIIKGGSVSRETALKHVPEPILLLATHLALHQLTLTLNSDTKHDSRLALENIQTIWFSTRNDAEKRTVVQAVKANPQIREAFGDPEIIDLNDETKLETRLEQTTNDKRSRHLVLVVDGNGDKKADPLRVSVPMNDSKNVVVFITSPSSNDYLTSKVDVTIKTEDHLLPWELFYNIVGSELLHSSSDIQEIAVQIVKKCEGHLLAIILMAKSLKHVTDVQLWELALQKLLYRDREAMVNALIFNIIWATNEMSEREKARLIRCLMVFKFQDDEKVSNDQLFARWLIRTLVNTKKEAKSMLQNLMECSLLLQFEDTQGRHIILPEDIKIIIYTIEDDIPENLSDGALVSTIPNLQVLNLSYTQMQHLHYLATTQFPPHYIDLSGWHVETLPRAICKLQTLETLWLLGCSQLRELPPEIAELQNLKKMRLEGCEQLEKLPQEIWELRKLETMSLEQCSQLLELSPRIAKLENLKELKLTGWTRLEAPPQEIWELHQLETLSLEQCSQLLELSPRIAELENLKELRLAGCTQLEALPQEIWELPNLKTLSLAGTSIFPSSENQELINSDDLPHSSSIYHEHSGPGKKTIPSSSSAIIPIGFTLKLKAHRRFKQFENFCQYIMQLQIENLEKCDLSSTQITDLPPSLNFPNLRSLSLRNNLNLMEIPSSFFDGVLQLSILDLSHTSIHKLPSSIFNLKELKELYLKECELFVELSPNLGQLTELVRLDLDGTLITHLPKEIRELKKLESLSLSFCNDSNSDPKLDVIPFGVLTQFTRLKVLRIDVNSENEWWLNNFEQVLVQFSTFKEELKVLDVHIPRVNFRDPIKKSLHNFRFIIGHHRPRMISRVPPAIEVKFRESGCSLKFVNGNEDFPDKVKTILSEARAFFLDRHMTVKNLTNFGLENLKRLRFCILAECNEMQSIVEVDEKSFEMQFLTIFYMKNLRSIINRPILGRPVFAKLKLLALHTCPELSTIFTMDFLHSLINLEELIVEDCPKVQSIISCPSSERTAEFFLPSLRKLSLLFVPELESISNGVRIARNLEQMGLYYCPKLQSLSRAELSSENLRKIRAETEWWKNLQWSEEWGQEGRPHKFGDIFEAFDEDLDILTQLTPYEVMTSVNAENDSG